MNNLSSQQRKLLYLGGILILLAPIIYLGLPAGGKDDAGKPIPGGGLAELRKQYDLGESNLGNVDPSSVTMNLVLLGLRGIAVNQLWIQMDKAKNEKDWTLMKEATRSIVKLQPHYEKVWDFNGWNMAWNTSSEWDAVPDRYYWVKEGGKFLIEGVGRNEKSTELRFRVATVFQKKLGVADESVLFRRYFLEDPDPSVEYTGKPDPKFNVSPEGTPYPDGQDSYLVASEWYRSAVDNEQRWKVPLKQGTLDRSAFHAKPAQCLFEYASALQKDGQFGEVTREAWARALEEWTKGYGAETLYSVDGQTGKIVQFKLEATEEDIRELAGPSLEDQARVRQAIDSFQKIVNYRYWRTRGMCESELETAEAHRNFYDAGEAFKAQKSREALELVEKAMTGLEAVLARFPELRSEDNMIEECMLAVKLWSTIYQLERDEPPPADFPLRTLWDEQKGRMNEVDRQFKLRFLTQSEG